jgi:hypothetical protein
MKDDTALSQDIFRQQAILDLEALEKQFNAGDDFALLLAIRKCANFDLVMPDWVARNFIRRFDLVLNCRTKSWDEAFGRPYSKGKHLKAMRDDREQRFIVWNHIRGILATDPDTVIDEALFERVGADLGIGKTRCGRLYYEALNMQLTSAKS